MPTLNPNRQHDGKIVTSRDTGRLRVHVDQNPEKDGKILFHQARAGDCLTQSENQILASYIANSVYVWNGYQGIYTMTIDISIGYDNKSFSHQMVIVSSGNMVYQDFDATVGGLHVSGRLGNSSGSLSGTINIYDTCCATEQARVSISNVSVGNSNTIRPLDFSCTEALDDRLCPCPTCFNTWSEICVESGSRCVPSDQEEFVFCRSGDRSDSIFTGSMGGGMGLLDKAARPQLYAPEEVKQYYPYWESLLDCGWDGTSDIWIEFQGTFNLQTIYEYDPVTGEYKSYQQLVWLGPPAKEQIVAVEYELPNPRDFTTTEDKQPVALWNDDITGCHSWEYVIAGDDVTANATIGSYPNIQLNPRYVRRHPQVRCNTQDCQCTMTKGEFKQWMKDNNRENPYYYIRARQKTSSVCANNVTGTYPQQVLRYYKSITNITFNITVYSQTNGTLTVSFTPTVPAGAVAHGVTIQQVIFNSLTSNGIFTQPLVFNNSDFSGEAKVEMVNGEGTIIITHTQCHKCNRAQGDEYKITETFVLGTYKYVTVNYDCTKCSGDNQAAGVNAWCYAEYKSRPDTDNPFKCDVIRPRGLYTTCLSSDGQEQWDDFYRCTAISYSKERVFKCCEVPPNLQSWWFYATTTNTQSNGGGGDSAWGARGFSFARSCSVYGGNDSPLTIALLWDNNTQTTASIPGFIGHTIVEGNSGDKPVLTWNAPGYTETKNYWTKCCNRFYYKLRVTPSDMKWYRWPTNWQGQGWSAISNANGVAYWWGSPESIKIELWVANPIVVRGSGAVAEPDDDEYVKYIDGDFNFNLNTPTPSMNCYYDADLEMCVASNPGGYGVQNGVCVSPPSFGGSCYPFTVSAGSSSPGIPVSGSASFSGYYGDACMISESTNPATDPMLHRNRREICSTSLPFRMVSTGQYSYIDVDNPRCYYPDCHYGFGTMYVGMDSFTDSGLRSQLAIQPRSDSGGCGGCGSGKILNTSKRSWS